MREKVKFSEKQPVLVKLDFNDGTECLSRNGETQYQYTVNDDAGIMYVNAPIRDYIQAQGAKAGDVVRITKYGADARQWAVEKALAPVRGAAAFPPTPTSQPAQRPPAAPPAPTRAVDAEAARMAASFSAAIEATAAAEQYAAAAGIRSLTLSDRETITKVALSIYIQRAKDGR